MKYLSHSLYSFFRIIIRFIFHYHLQKVRRLQNIHKGQTCYIFGDGTSVQQYDLSSYSSYPAIIAGFLIFHRDYNLLHPIRYLLLVEPFYLYPVFKNETTSGFWLNTIQAQLKKALARKSNTVFITHIANIFGFTSRSITRFHAMNGFPDCDFCKSLNSVIYDRSMVVLVPASL